MGLFFNGSFGNSRKIPCGVQQGREENADHGEATKAACRQQSPFMKNSKEVKANRIINDPSHPLAQ